MNKIIYLALLFFSCNNTTETKETGSAGGKKSISQETAEVSYSIQIVKNDTSGYGYEIHSGNKPVISQPVIPAIQGNHAFRTEEDAQKVAGLMKKKMEEGIQPPTITIQELEELDVLPE